MSLKYVQPDDVYEFVFANAVGEEFLNETNRTYLQANDIWAIHLDQEGQVVESYHKPAEVPAKFSLSDIVRFTRFYLQDYPVFTYVAGDGILVFGYPKGSLDKLPFNYVSTEALWLNFKLALLLGMFFVFFNIVLYYREVRLLRQKLEPLETSIEHLYKDSYQPLDETGDLKSIAVTINQANQNYKLLKESQAQWLRGISHDIRTPLTKINWGLEKLKTAENSFEICQMNRHVMQISKTIEDLNLTNRLDTLSTDIFVETNPITVIRQLIVDTLNEHPEREILFNNTVANEVKILMDAGLFSRMLENIIQNSLNYSSGIIKVTTSLSDHQFIVECVDLGPGLSEEVIARLNTCDISKIKSHGLGLFISKQIAQLHHGEMEIANQSLGLKVSFYFDLSSEISI
ncbi:sensor histidine kinase [Aerococcus urinaehominis]|uniref:sensor histidine kinase n=1 Tax=Aerococcus urinaehominis TaxID=128944 RepID=UPI00130ED0A7|nr:HAMP domain-containing sensor histidine kinase [Aerococcus urinaehominis]